ncbi:trigger factor family protein, partial [Candidatus Parcubacteria bacterium]|nr:trigger factor family protein [Candidatus Parcubacteria bacterium]
METNIKNLPKSQKELTIEIPVEEMEKYVNKALDKMSKIVKADGFRQGKVPKDIARKKLGEPVLFEEAVHIAIETTYLETIKENKLNPIGQPKADITKSAMGNPLEYKIIITVMPEVTLSDYGKISGEIEKVKI